MTSILRGVHYSTLANTLLLLNLVYISLLLKLVKLGLLLKPQSDLIASERALQKVLFAKNTTLPAFRSLFYF